MGGVILFSRNIESVGQLRSLNRSLQKISSSPLLIGVDQEGGRVARLKKPFTEIPPMALVGKYFRRTKDAKTVKGIGQILGRELRAVGFNWDFAPVVDVHSNPRNPVIGDRAFGPDPRIVTQCAAAVMRGLHREGVVSCVKHFPGHGDTSTDSHKTLPVLKAPGRLIWRRDLFPYRKLFRLGLVKTLMTAHVKYPDLDEQYCATLSEEIINNLLRGRMDYKGLVVSDDLLMKAIAARMNIPDAVLRFLQIGGDLALICREPHLAEEAIRKTEEAITQKPEIKRQLLRSFKKIQKLKKDFLLSRDLLPENVIGCSDHFKLIEIINAED